jgi:membrane fusion protein (multidrug efflux system)
MVRVALKPIQSHISPVIPQEAILADQQGDYVFVVGDDKIATVRRIKTGAEFGSMREVISGLEADEDIIAQGLQAIRPNLPVNPVSPRNRSEEDSPAARARESGYDVRPASPPKP